MVPVIVGLFVNEVLNDVHDDTTCLKFYMTTNIKMEEFKWGQKFGLELPIDRTQSSPFNREMIRNIRI